MPLVKTWIHQVTQNVPVHAGSPKLSSDEPDQYLDGWPLKQQQLL